MGVPARSFTWTSDGQDGMSRQGVSPDCSYRRRLRDCASTRQATLMRDDVRLVIQITGTGD